MLKRLNWHSRAEWGLDLCFNFSKSVESVSKTDFHIWISVGEKATGLSHKLNHW